MAELNDDLNILINVRNNIKTSLVSKGENPSDDIRTYANNIQNIYTSNSTIIISNGTKLSHSTVTSFPNLDLMNVTNMHRMFLDCKNLSQFPTINNPNITDISYMFYNCYNLVDVPEFNTGNVTYMHDMFGCCNNLSDASIQNIINMCLNSRTSLYKRLRNTDDFSVFEFTNVSNTRYQNRWSELSAKGWSY